MTTSDWTRQVAELVDRMRQLAATMALPAPAEGEQLNDRLGALLDLWDATGQRPGGSIDAGAMDRTQSAVRRHAHGIAERLPSVLNDVRTEIVRLLAGGANDRVSPIMLSAAFPAEAWAFYGQSDGIGGIGSYLAGLKLSRLGDHPLLELLPPAAELFQGETGAVLFVASVRRGRVEDLPAWWTLRDALLLTSDRRRQQLYAADHQERIKRQQLANTERRQREREAKRQAEEAARAAEWARLEMESATPE